MAAVWHRTYTGMILHTKSNVSIYFNLGSTKRENDTELNGKVAEELQKLEDRSQKKKIMFLLCKNKASRKGYKGEW